MIKNADEYFNNEIRNISVANEPKRFHKNIKRFSRYTKNSMILNT